MTTRSSPPPSRRSRAGRVVTVVTSDRGPGREVDGCRSRRPRCALAARPAGCLTDLRHTAPASPSRPQRTKRREPESRRHRRHGPRLAAGLSAAVRFAQDPAGAGPEAGTRPTGERHDHLQRLDAGRKAAADRRWADALELLARVDARGGLGASDLEVLATAALLRGEPRAAVDALSRAYSAHLGVQDTAGAARSAGWLALNLIEQGDFTNSVMWAARAMRIVRGDGRARRAGRLRPAGAGCRAARQRERRRGGPLLRGDPRCRRARGRSGACGDHETRSRQVADRSGVLGRRLRMPGPGDGCRRGRRCPARCPAG